MASLPLAGLLRESLLSKTVTCANRWHQFPPESALWVSVHPKLAGEPQLDLSQTAAPGQRRFIPERFDVECRAVDCYGSPCTQVACPRCRLDIPRASLEIPSVVISLLGASGSGKSVFLTSTVFTMRQQARRLGLRFQDADLSLNKQLTSDEQRMFLDPAAEEYRPFNSAVEKTKEEDGRFRSSRIDGHIASFVPPYTFVVIPSDGHPKVGEAHRLSRLLCLYDNAGEHFRPGADAAGRPMTRHLAASKGLMFTFDPTKVRRLRRQLGDKLTGDWPGDRQDIVLIEAANRIREHAGISSTDPIPQAVVVVLTKFDVWRTLLPEIEELNPLRAWPGTNIECLAWNEVKTTSALCRDLLCRYSPELVTAADSISNDVVYVPVASVGWDVRTDTTTGLPVFRGADCQPQNVLVPLLRLLSKAVPRVVPAWRSDQSR